MNATFDPQALDDAAIDLDIVNDFERAWAMLDDGDEPAPAGESVLLECNGELLESSAIDIVDLRKIRGGAEVIEFICPRCGEPHESLRFR